MMIGKKRRFPAAFFQIFSRILCSSMYLYVVVLIPVLLVCRLQNYSLMKGGVFLRHHSGHGSWLRLAVIVLAAFFTDRIRTIHQLRAGDDGGRPDSANADEIVDFAPGSIADGFPVDGI